MNDSIINRFVNNLPFELHLWDPKVGRYSACGPGTKHKKRIQKYTTTGDVKHIYKNELDRACFYHDAEYSKYKDVQRRQNADRKLMEEALKIIQNNSLDGYQRALAAMIYQFFQKKIQLGQGVDDLLKDTYYNAKTGYSSIQELSRRTSVPKNNVRDWLLQQETYTKHKPIKYKYPTRRVLVYGVDDQWQADLVDMREMSRENKNTNYILTIIDVFSKFAWAIPIKRKTGDEIAEAFKTIFLYRQPKKLHTDKGTEFINKKTQELLKSYGIHWFTTQNETKAQVVERFNRTLKDRMYRYFTAKKTSEWIDVLQDLVDNYNTSYHRSIKMTPIEASKEENEVLVWKNLYGKTEGRLKPKFKVGDFVRISRWKGTFKEGKKLIILMRFS